MTITWNIEDELLEWYRMSPDERWRQSSMLWQFYESSGGSLEPEPDSQSPFDPRYASGAVAPDRRSGPPANLPHVGRAGVHFVRGR